MSDEIDDGGQAFPLPYTVGPNDDLYPADPGMTLRDWFAGQALAGMLGSPNVVKRDSTVISGESEYAASAYDFADAMIAARKQ